MDEQLTDREIKHMLSDIKAIAIETRDQAVKTNGRVTRLELWQARLEGAGTMAKIGWGVIGVFLIAASFALFKMYVEFQSIDEKIKGAVSQQLSEYNPIIYEEN